MSVEEKVGKDFDDWAGLVSQFKKEKILAFLPGEREYELSTATANLLYRFTRPHFVVQPETWAEVLTIVDVTYEKQLHGLLTVKGGGHSFTGFSTVDKGIVVDMKRMNDVTLLFTKDKRPNILKVEAGARWGDVYRKLIRKDCRGYVVNGGRCPSVGVGGFLLGGGLGPFGRTLGLGSDTIVGATIITLKGGKAVKEEVDEEKDKELFWALRGGGTAAFGIVTEFKLKVCALKNPDKDKGVAACRYVWFPNQSWKQVQDKEEREQQKAEQDAELFKTMDAFYAAEWPDEMTIDSNWMFDMDGDKGKLGIRFTIYYDGSQDDCNKLFEQHIIDKDLKLAFQRRTIPEPTTRFLHETLFLMWEEEAVLTLPRIADNSYQLWCSFVFEDDAEKMKKVIRTARIQQDSFEQQFQNDKAGLSIVFIHSGGEITKNTKNITSAYPWRQGVFQCHVTVKWGEKWLEVRAREAILNLKKDMSQYALNYNGECASYVNFSDATLAVQGNPEISYYGENFARLAALKEKMDSKNHFKWPWETDTQEWRDLKKNKERNEANKEDKKEEKKAAKEVDTAALAKNWTDVIAGRDWDTYDLPPPAYTELYAPSYLERSQYGATSV